MSGRDPVWPARQRRGVRSRGLLAASSTGEIPWLGVASASFLYWSGTFSVVGLDSSGQGTVRWLRRDSDGNRVHLVVRSKGRGRQ